MSRLLLFVPLLLLVAACDSGAPVVPGEDSRQFPLAPILLQVASSDAASLTLSWRDQSEFETGFAIERVPWNGDFNDAEAPPPTEGFETVATVDANVTTYTDTDLATATRWVYRVRPTGGESEASEAVLARPRVLSRVEPGGRYRLAPRGEVLLIGTSTETRLYDPAEGRLLRAGGPTANLRSAGDGCSVSSLREDIFVLDSDLATLATIEVDPSPSTLEISRDCSRLLARAPSTDDAVIYDAQTGEEVTRMSGFIPRTGGRTATMTPDGSVLFGARSESDRVEARSTVDGSTLWSVPMQVTGAIAYAEGQVHVARTDLGQHVVLDAQTGAQIAVWPDTVSSIFALPVGDYAVSLNNDRVSIYRLSDFSLVRTLIPFSESGRLLGGSSVEAEMGPNGLRLAVQTRGFTGVSQAVYTYDLDAGWESAPVE